jgi:hypothetical protein
VSATFGGGWDAAMALPWDELILRWAEAAELHDDTWGALVTALVGRAE